MVSDGISSMVTDEEIMDLARNVASPKLASERIVSYVEDLGGEDNMTAIVIPLAGWGKMEGHDSTLELRNYKMEQSGRCRTCDLRSGWI